MIIMMIDAVVQIEGDQTQFYVGETIKGQAEVALPANIPLENVFVSFHCLGEVKWNEMYTGTPHYLKEMTFYDKYDYHDEELQFEPKDVARVAAVNGQKYIIPFSFKIPDDKNLPTSMVSDHGSINYYIQVAVNDPEAKDEEKFKKFLRTLIVISPMDKNLMVTVGGTVDKHVLLHNGDVSLHASIGRKGFAPGETITVHVHIDNKTNAKVKPRMSLHQVQIYMCGMRHKTLESSNPDGVVEGTEIAAHSQGDEVLDVTIPPNEALSIKSSVITVKYFIRVDLDIPHSFDLHLNLPIVLTSKRTIEQHRNPARD